MNQLSYIDPNAKIAKNVEIGPFSTIYGDVTIDEGTWIGSNVTIMDGARIGKNCRIFPGAVVSSDPQDLKYNNEKTETFVGDNTTIREFVTVSRGTTDKMKTIIGGGCLLMAYVHVAHDCKVGDNCILANAVQVAGHVEIADFTVVGGSSAIHQFVRIGKHAMIAGGALVRKDVPPYAKAAREPLVYCGVNSIGLRRRGFTNEKIDEIQEVYRHLFFKGLNNSSAISAIEGNFNASTERDEILQFIRTSNRGILKSYNQ